jgi:hypothetical protein
VARCSVLQELSFRKIITNSLVFWVLRCDVSGGNDLHCILKAATCIMGDRNKYVLYHIYTSFKIQFRENMFLCKYSNHVFMGHVAVLVG